MSEVHELRVIEVPAGAKYLRCCQCGARLMGQYIDTGLAAICLTCPLPDSYSSQGKEIQHGPPTK